MKIALFGANSSVSKSLRRLLSANEVITFGRSGADVIVDINHISPGFSFPPNISTLVLSSAHFGGSEIDDYVGAIEVNTIGSLKIFDLAIKSGINHVIYISTVYSYFDAKSANSSIYSISKKFGEEVLLQYAKTRSITLTILRPSQIFADCNSIKIHQPFLFDLLDKIKKSQDVVIYGTKNPKRNFIHIDDVSMVIYKVILKKLDGVFDCAFPQNTSFLEIVEYAKNFYKSDSKVSFDHSKPDLINNTLNYDFSLYDLIGFYPSITIDQSIQRLKI